MLCELKSHCEAIIHLSLYYLSRLILHSGSPEIISADTGRRQGRLETSRHFIAKLTWLTVLLNAQQSPLS